MSKQLNPAGRVDVLIQSTVDLFLKRFVETHRGYAGLNARLKEVGVDLGTLARDEVSRRLKRERITDVKSLRRALHR